MRALLAAFEILILSALILATRCANCHDVFVEGNIYFIDADCYARMTRARMRVTDDEQARQLLRNRHIDWVFAYD